MKVIYKILLKLLFISILCISCNNNSRLKQKETQNPTIETVDAYITHLMERHGIPGTAVAIIKNDTLMHQNNYGLANIEHNVPVTDATVFRVYSITKIFIAVGIFQLIEKRKLSLKDKISNYLTDLPEKWKDIQIKHLLTHSSGLPDFKLIPNYNDLTKKQTKEQLFTQDILYRAGERYEYNQTNYWFLHEIIEKVSGLSLTDFIIPNQFNSQTDTVFFSSDSRDIVPNRATLYFNFAKDKLTIEHPYGGDINFATNGMNLTLNEFIEWSKKLDKNLLLKQKTMDAMWQEFPFQNEVDLFTIGWDKFESDGGISYGFTGNITNVYRIFPEQNLSVIFLANGSAHMFNFDVDGAANHLAFLVDKKLKNPKTYVYEKLIQVSTVKDGISFEETFRQMKKEYADEVDIESLVNKIGYFHLRKKNYNIAVQIFAFNNSAYPTSWNTYDSLGEAYETTGNMKEAIILYQKAIELNSENEGDNNTRLKNRISILKKTTP